MINFATNHQGDRFSLSPFFISLQPSNGAIPRKCLEDASRQFLPKSFIFRFRDLGVLYGFSVFLRMPPQDEPRIYAGCSSMV